MAASEIGIDIREARLRRNLPMSLLAERALTTRSTLRRVEQGDPGVSMGIYAVLHSLGLLDGLRESAIFAFDGVGRAIAGAALPERARARLPKRGTGGAGRIGTSGCGKHSKSRMGGTMRQQVRSRQACTAFLPSRESASVAGK